MFFLDILLYLNFTLFAFSLPVYCSINYKISPEKSFLPFFILNSAIFYLFAIFHISGIGFWLIYLANMLLYIPAIRKMRRFCWNDFVQSIFTPGVVVLFSMMSILFLLVRHEQCNSWDSVSHWMTSVKFFFDEQKLCCEYPKEILLHASYPPGMSMTSMLVHKCFFGIPFREGIVMFAYTLPIYAGLAWFFSKIRYEQKILFLFATLLAVILVPFSIIGGYFDLCYTDLSLAVVMAVTFYQMFLTTREYSVSNYFLLALMNGWMYMIRNAGWGYSLAIMVFFGVFLFIDRRKAFYEAGKNTVSKLKVATAGLVFLFPILMRCIWKYLLKYYSTPLRFEGTNISWTAIQAAFGDKSSPIWNFLSTFLCRISVNHIPVLIAIAIIAFIMIKKFTDPVVKRGLRITVFFFIPAAVLFQGTLFLYYYFESLSVNNTFPSLDRYFYNFAVIPILIIILFLLEQLAQKQSIIFTNKRLLALNDKIFVQNKKAATIAVIISAAAVIWIGGFCSVVVKVGDQLAFARWRRDCDRVLVYNSHLQPGVRFGHISTSGTGYKRFYMQYLYPYNHFSDFPEDPLLDDGRKETLRPYGTPLTLETLQQELKKVDYVFMDDPKEDFLRDFKVLFVPGFEPKLEELQGKMLKVTPEGKLAPVKMDER